MKLSAKSRYAARYLIDLTVCGKDHPLSITKIGACKGISERYLGLIFATLRKTGFIAGARGSQSGYQLIRPIESITIYNIVTLMKTNASIVNTRDERDPVKRILMRGAWSLIDDNLKTYLSDPAIAELSLS